MSQRTNVPELDKELAVLLSLLVTDGSVSRKGSTWKVEFTNTSEKLIEQFISLVFRIFKRDKIAILSDKREKRIKRAMFTDKRVGNFLWNLLNRKSKKLPNFIFQLDKDAQSSVLRTLFSCDGGVSLWVVKNKRKNVWEIKKWIKFASINKELRTQVMKLLKNLGIKSIEREINDELLITRKSEILKFQKLVGFVDGVKVTRNSKNWFGFEKNQVLDLAVKSFELRKKDLKKFKTKEEVIAFLKSMIL